MSHLDAESKEFLKVCQRFGGKARSDIIRRETGMSRGQRDRRFAKLEDQGFILVHQTDEPLNGGGIPPRVAVLTDKARQAIDDGLLDAEDDANDGEELTRVSVTEFKDVQSRLDATENRLDSLSQAINSLDSESHRGESGGDPKTPVEIQQVRADVEALQDHVAEIEELNEQMEYVYRWIGRAEVYMKSSRYLFEEMGLDFEAAMNDVESDEVQVKSGE